MPPQPQVVVVGAGAAGVIAAWRAASLGAKVLLLEKTNRIGTKILISGGGKCNITHAGPLEEVLRAFRPNEARFIRPACYRFPNDEVVEMLTSRGLKVYTRPDGRIFPVDQTAKDVVAILQSYMDDVGVHVRLESPVTGIRAVGGRIVGVTTGEPRAAHSGYRESGPAGGDTLWPCEHLIVATGGSSYPNSGTTGDAWPWARELGHRVEKVRAALAPIYMNLEPAPPEERAGVALRNIVLKARQNNKEISKWTGDLLFTHQGVSGPTVLGVSRVVAERIHEGEVTLEVDLVQDKAQDQVSEDLLRHVTENPRKLVASYVDPLVPNRLVGSILQAAGVAPDTPGARLDRRSRNRLSEVLKRWQLGKVRTVPLEKGEVVAGGITLDEVDPHTMKSRKVEGLYLCGEVLDIAGPVGGYNLQAAFATGFVAGETAAKAALGG
jgi:hypothetical protein